MLMLAILRAAVAPLTLLMAAAFVWGCLAMPADQWDAADRPRDVPEIGWRP